MPEIVCEMRVMTDTQFDVQGFNLHNTQAVVAKVIAVDKIPIPQYANSSLFFHFLKKIKKQQILGQHFTGWSTL